MASTVFERNRPAASVIDHSLSQSAASVFWLDDLPARAPRARLNQQTRADLVIVGGGYTGLWSALAAKRRDPDTRVVLLEARTIGHAASGRNGGFCDASLTHGRENGLSRWPEEIDTLDRLGLANLDAMGADIQTLGIDAEWERTGSLNVALEQHEIAWLDDWAEESAARGDTSPRRLSENQTRAEVNSPTYLGAVWETETTALVHPGKLAAGLADAAERAGVEVFEHSPARSLRTDSTGVTVATENGSVTAARAILATNVFPSLLRRNRLMTVPVYDYVLMTEPLSAEQRDAIGWHNRQGLADLANQFHYYRLTADNRILFGGYDAIYHYGGRVRQRYEDRPETFTRLASHFFSTFPQLEGLRFSHRWAGAIDTSTQFCAFFGTARDDRVAYAAGFTGLGVAATRFAADVMLDLLEGADTERTRLEMVRKRPLPFPPEPAASIGINATRWSLNQADHHGGKRNALLKTLDALGLGFDS